MFTYEIEPNLSLKLLEVRDAERVFELIQSSRDYLREWLPWVDFTKEEQDTKAFIQSCLQAYIDNKGLHTAIVFHNEIVGLVSFNTIDHRNKSAQIGYWLGEGYQGHGIMTKVTQALIDYAIGEWKLNRIEIRAGIDNHKSRAIPKRLGFTYEGTSRQAEWVNDHFVDHAVYSMLADKWNTLQEVAEQKI